VLAEGVNFCAFSRHATRVLLLLYARADSPAPYQTIELSPERNRTYAYWHVFVEGLGAGALYAWRMDGPKDTRETGRAFSPGKDLADPCARAVTVEAWDRRRAADPDDDGHAGIRAVVTEALPARTVTPADLAGAVIYELHVGGFTRHPSSAVRHPGTFEGLAEKIPYLRDLGVTHVELMPVMAFDEQDVPAGLAARGLRNYWGYSPHGFFCPHPRYCVDPMVAPREFRALTDALHAAGLRLILDVVFNHTAEGGADGPVIHFKGMANEGFYLLEPGDRRRYLDFTGCGNTVNCNHPIVTAYAVQCLEYWVEELGVDGFRFDLASVFTRGPDGKAMATPPLPWAIEASRVLSRVPLIAEAWDAAGLYHVGAFPGMGWAEWNGRYRDSVRRFIRGDPGLAGEVATRIAGSADLYGDDGRLPANSVNFVTCHDGFTLADLVSYERKRNEGNGQGGRDGADDNASWNCGVEGETSDPAVVGLRLRQARNHLAVLMLSRGVPMLLAGDEVLRTQRGNNNAWCQDNELSWIDWRRTAAQEAMLRFTRELIALRRRHACLERNRFFEGRPAPGRSIPDIAWHGARLGESPWKGEGRILRFTIAGLTDDEEDLHVILNMSVRPLVADLPVLAGRRWHVAVDTSRPPPEEVVPWPRQRPHPAPTYRVAARSVVVLEAR
jgi:glycogen operon protein